ncbi:MAG TPA: hypothetical protein ENN43_00395, partial [bacterium]|nr:hypothetical protein [bacterium]
MKRIYLSFFILTASYSALFGVYGETMLLAGIGRYWGDGNVVPHAAFNNPNYMAINPSADEIYIADGANNVIRMINSATGYISTFAGTGAAGYQDGPREEAVFNNPHGLRYDYVNDILYVSDA